jgi:hypothetical protein
MGNKEDYCLGNDGNMKTKCSEALQLMGYHIGDVVHGSITESEGFKYLMKTHNFKEVPEKMWQKYIKRFK